MIFRIPSKKCLIRFLVVLVLVMLIHYLRFTIVWSTTEHYKVESDDIPIACEYPYVDPFEPSVVKLARLDRETIHCNNTFPPDLTYIEDGQIVVNTSKIDQILKWNEFKYCKYQQIFRDRKSDKTFITTDWSKPFTNRTFLPSDAEFLKVGCFTNETKLISKSYYFLIPRKHEFDEQFYLNMKKRQVEASPKETLNVIMVGIDSMPRNLFLRAMNKTYSFLMDNLQSFDFAMHAQLGINTFLNFLPLFAGRSEEDVNKWWNDSHHLDTVDLIWRTFERAGYRTLFVEDWPNGGAFHYLRKGFVFPFVTYNYRPLGLALEGDKELWSHNHFCVGNKLELKFQLDYIDLFLDTFYDKPAFAVGMFSNIVHDDPTQAKMVDEYFFNFYKSLHEKGILNRTLLISFSDHGTRYGILRKSVNGDFESRTPYTILTFPKWFLAKYPDVARNLDTNTRRLTSHFDTHATLLDLLYFKSDKPAPVAPLRHGISLFHEIPRNRTCEDVPIPADFCLCGLSANEEIDPKSDISGNLSEYVLQVINSNTNHELCASLKVKRTLRVLKTAIRINYDKGKNVTTVYKIKLQTTPGDGIFDANVYFQDNSTVPKVGPGIDRLDKYAGQADCVNSRKQQLFCYCKNLLKG